MSTEQRKGDYIRTWSGKSFYPLHPDLEQIDIQDIAWALSMQCRYAGHVKHFYSVAQHSVYVSQACDEADALWGLLHDASEAYIQDIIRPVKIHLPEYKEIEARWEKVIAEKFNLCWPMPESVKRADEAVFATEVIQLRPKVHSSMNSTESPIGGLKITEWSPEQARRKFLLRFNALFYLEVAI